LSAADAIRGWTAAEQEEWIAHPVGPVEFRHCIGAVDATYVRIQRPKRYEDERRLYSTYKKYHAVFFICIIDRHGTLMSSSRERWSDGRQAWTACSSLSPSAFCLCRAHPLPGRGQPAKGLQ